MDNKTTVICYSYYDERKRRLAIMAEDKGENIDVTVITCSRKDPFTKKEARRALENSSLGQETYIGEDLVHPQKFTIINNGQFKEEFFKWVSSNYLKLHYQAKWVPVLMGNYGKVKRAL